MKPLTDRDKRTIRIGAIFIVAYLALFYGVKGWRQLESRRHDYQALLQSARDLRAKVQPYEKRILQAEKLKKKFQLDPLNLSNATVVAEASAAIQKAAAGGGVKLGPIRESPARSSGKELVSMQLEALGPVQAIVGLLPRLDKLGFPILIESVQMSSEPSKPGILKLNLTITILDFEHWKAEEENRHA